MMEGLAELCSLLRTLYSLAEEYGVPLPVVNAVLAFALVLLLGRPLISFFLRVSYRRFPELSQETRSSYIGMIHIIALAIVTLSAFLDLRLAAVLAFVLLVAVPLVAGLAASIKSRGEGRTRRTEETALRRALMGKKAVAGPKKDNAGTAPTGDGKRACTKIRIPSIPLSKILGAFRRPGERKGRRRARSVRSERKGPALVVEEITFEEGAAGARKAREGEGAPPAGEAPKEVPRAEAAKVEEFRKAVEELEALAGREKTRPAPTRPGAPVDEGALVREIEKAVEEKVIRAKKHRFITWREALEMRKRAKETVKRMEPVVKERVRRRLKEKGTLTREDLDEIAEEILYQIQRSEALAGPPGKAAAGKGRGKGEEKKGPRKRREKEKEKKKEEDLLAGGDEDILALLGEEEPGEDIGSELEELEKLLEEK